MERDWPCTHGACAAQPTRTFACPLGVFGSPTEDADELRLNPASLREGFRAPPPPGATDEYAAPTAFVSRAGIAETARVICEAAARSRARQARDNADDGEVDESCAVAGQPVPESVFSVWLDALSNPRVTTDELLHFPAVIARKQWAEFCTYGVDDQVVRFPPAFVYPRRCAYGYRQAMIPLPPNNWTPQRVLEEARVRKTPPSRVAWLASTSADGGYADALTTLLVDALFCTMEGNTDVPSVRQSMQFALASAYRFLAPRRSGGGGASGAVTVLRALAQKSIELLENATYGDRSAEAMRTSSQSAGVMPNPDGGSEPFAWVDAKGAVQATDALFRLAPNSACLVHESLECLASRVLDVLATDSGGSKSFTVQAAAMLSTCLLSLPIGFDIFAQVRRHQ